MARRFPLSRLRAGLPEVEPVAEVNIIPVIDVSLVLLVILFVSAPLMSYPSLKVELPRSASGGPGERVIPVTMTADGRLAVASKAADWASLPALLAEAVRRLPDGTVVLRADRSAPYRDVERALSAARDAGARAVALGTEQPR